MIKHLQRVVHWIERSDVNRIIQASTENKEEEKKKRGTREKPNIKYFISERT